MPDPIIPNDLDYDSTGADDTDETLKEVLAKRGDNFEPTTPAESDNSESEVVEPAKQSAVEAAAAAAKTPEELAAEAADAALLKENQGKTPEEIAAEKKAAEDAVAAAAAGTPPATTEEPAPAGAVDDKGQLIPRRRYDSVKSRLDAAEAELEKFRKGEIKPTAAPNPSDPSTWAPQQKLSAIDSALVSLDAKILKAQADGNGEEFTNLRTQERRLVAARQEIVAEQYAARSVDTVTEGSRYDRALSTLEAAFPAINVDSEHYDQALEGRLGELVVAFEKTGLTESQALIKAAQILEPQLEASVAKTKAPAVAAGKTAAQIEAEKAAVATAEADRKKAAVAKAVSSANKQPPSLNATGLDSNKKGQGEGKISVLDMSDEEYDALPESKRKELRGDTRVPA